MQREQAIIAILRANSMRLTRARRGFVTLLSTAPKPLSVNDILESLNGQGVEVNKTTVYRELERFQQLGLLHTVDLGGRRQYFELISSDGHHHHFVCLECDLVEDVELDERDLARQERGFVRQNGWSVLKHSLEFFGLCARCQKICP